MTQMHAIQDDLNAASYDLDQVLKDFGGKGISLPLAGSLSQIWDVTKLVSEHDLEVDDCMHVHLKEDPLLATDITMG